MNGAYILSHGAGFVLGISNLIVEDREVESQSKADRVSGRQTLSCLHGIFICFLRLLNNI